MSAVSAAQIYADELMSHHYGMPMWSPEPPDGGEVRVGDVGFLQDGAFCRLFNATPRDEGDDSPFDLPENFESIIIPQYLIRSTPNYLPQSPISSRTARKVDVTGELSA